MTADPPREDAIAALRDAIDGERADWHRVEVDPRHIATLLALNAEVLDLNDLRAAAIAVSFARGGSRRAVTDSRALDALDAAVAAATQRAALTPVTPAPLDVERLARALMANLDVDPCEGVTWGTPDSANELATAIIAALRA